MYKCTKGVESVFNENVVKHIPPHRLVWDIYVSQCLLSYLPQHLPHQKSSKTDNRTEMEYMNNKKEGQNYKLKEMKC